MLTQSTGDSLVLWGVLTQSTGDSLVLWDMLTQSTGDSSMLWGLLTQFTGNSLLLYTYIYILIYICICMHTCMCTGGLFVCTHVRVQKSTEVRCQKSEEYSGVRYCSMQGSMRQVLSLNLRLTVSAKQTPHQTPKICLVLCPAQYWGYIYDLPHLSFCECWGLKLRVSCLPSEHSYSLHHHPSH